MGTIRYALCGVLLSFSLNSYAAGVDCDDLADLAGDLDQIAEALTQVEVIHEGDELDQALGQLVDALQVVAEVEDSDKLYRRVDQLTQAYNNMDSDQFEGAIDHIIGYMDRMYIRDCE